MTDPLASDWIDAANALQLTKLRSGVLLAKQILERARDGIIQSRARHYLVEGPNRRGPPGTQRVHEQGYYKVPPEFFWAASGQALEANWATGDFSTWIDSTWHCRAYGVQFLEAEINAMSPLLRPAIDNASRSEPLRVHTDAELEQWILSRPMTKGDTAHEFYKLDPAYNGIKQAEFRKLWARLRNTRRGSHPRRQS